MTLSNGTCEWATILDIQAAATANLVTHFTWVQRQTICMRADINTNLVLTDCGLPCDTFNSVCQARLLSDNAHEQIKTAVGYFADKGRPFSWWVSPGDQPANLGKLLL